MLSIKIACEQVRRFSLKALVIVLSAFVLTSCPTPLGTVRNFPRTGITNPGAIVAGADGNLWFTNAGTHSVGRITPAGDVYIFVDAKISDPQGIVAGPD